MTVEEHLIEVNHRPVRYYEAGEPHRDAIVLLHGDFGDAALHWRDIMPELAETYYALALDLPGYGQSQALRRMDIASLAQWLVDTMGALGVDRASLVGNSFGALIARAAAANRPGAVATLTLVNGGAIPAVPGGVKVLSRVPGLGHAIYRWLSGLTASRKELRKAVHVESVISDEFVTRVRDNVPGLARLMRAMTVSSVPEQMIPSTPTLILWGEDDGIINADAGRQLADLFPDVKYADIAGCGHMPHLEAPDVFLGQLTTFLGEINRRGHTRGRGPTMLG